MKKLYSLLPNKSDLYRVPFPKFNHLDFIWGKDAPELVYKKLLKIMKKFDNQSDNIMPITKIRDEYGTPNLFDATAIIN